MAFKAEDPAEQFAAEYVRANPQKSIRRVAKAVHHAGFGLAWDRVRDIRSAVRSEMGLEPPAAPSLKVVPSSGEKVALPAPFITATPDAAPLPDIDPEPEEEKHIPSAYRHDPELKAKTLEKKRWLNEWLDTHPDVLSVTFSGAQRALKAQFNGATLYGPYIKETVALAHEMAKKKTKRVAPRTREVAEHAAKKQRVALEFIQSQLELGAQLNIARANAHVYAIFGQGLNSKWLQKALAKMRRAHERKAQKRAAAPPVPTQKTATDALRALATQAKALLILYPGLELTLTVKNGKVNVQGEVKTTLDIEV